MSVRPKNANRMSKLSSSHAVGPTSDMRRSNSRWPVSVTAYTIRGRRVVMVSSPGDSSMKVARSSFFSVG